MTPAPLIPAPLPPTAAEAVEELHLAIGALPEYAVPCVADGRASDWVSDHPVLIARAIDACEGCPVLAECEAFGVTTRAEGVVLAGRRWGPHTAKNLAARGTHTSSATAAEDHERNAS